MAGGLHRQSRKTKGGRKQRIQGAGKLGSTSIRADLEAPVQGKGDKDEKSSLRKLDNFVQGKELVKRAPQTTKRSSRERKNVKFCNSRGKEPFFIVKRGESQ